MNHLQLRAGVHTLYCTQKEVTEVNPVPSARLLLKRSLQWTFNVFVLGRFKFFSWFEARCINTILLLS